MSSLFRSQEMTLCQLFLQSEAVYSCVSELGELGLVQFRDLNPNVNAFQRKFVNEVRRCDEMERKLRYLEKEIKKDNIPVLDVGDNPEAPQPREMIELEDSLENLEKELREVNTNAESLKRTFLELTELKHILKQTESFFAEQEQTLTETESIQKSLVAHDFQSAQPQLRGFDIVWSQVETTTCFTLISDPPDHLTSNDQTKTCFVSGVILKERVPSFERMLWRVCKGNVFLRQSDIQVELEDPVTGDQVFKTVFVIYFQGEQLRTKVKKICEGFRAVVYPCPETSTERNEMSEGVRNRIDDLNIVLRQTQDHRHRVLVTAAKDIKDWVVKVRKIKAIYITMNLFNLDVTQKCLIAECWCPVVDLDKIQNALHRAMERSGSSVPSILHRMETSEVPPTYNRTNKFTQGFQGIVDAYGVADYREANPAPYTIITFPFLFAVMFGDFGHGVLMFLFALWMVLQEKKLERGKSQNEMWNAMFGGRYIVLLMGAFSIYTGLIYNDVFSKSFNIFHSSWKVPEMRDDDKVPDMNQLSPNSSYKGIPYPLGIDPVWQFASNKIVFLNSYKMKGSIIFGVLQMAFGVIISFFNNLHFRRPIKIFCEFIPQIIFLMCLFGYLVILIFYKWVNTTVDSANCARSILIHFINMFLFTYPTEPCYLQPIYPAQQKVQTALVVMTVVCIPWMLLSRPLILRHQHLRRQQQLENRKTIVCVEDGHDNDEIDTTENQKSRSSTNQSTKSAGNTGHSSSTENSGGHASGGHGEKKDFDFPDLFINQAIHTIEFCLGSISHTASYLRLWALSLAHAQLSEVLWNMVLVFGLKMNSLLGGFVMYFIFFGWAVLTVGVLLIMEGLSAFLHALRLHWVEFQSKFYGGTGYMFQPFDFETMLENANSEEM